jgi:hypothetical protein
MRPALMILSLSLLLAGAGPGFAADGPEAAVSQPAMEPQPVQLGGGVVLPRPAFDQIIAQDGGLAVIERMQERARYEPGFEGLPHLIVILVAVLLFFWSTMIYYQRKHARLHRTIQLMVEKGVPLPPEILRAAEEAESSNERGQGRGIVSAAPPWAANLLWGGLLWITIGLAGGSYLYLRGNDAWPWALAAVIYGTAAVATARKKGREAL